MTDEVTLVTKWTRPARKGRIDEVTYEFDLHLKSPNVHSDERINIATAMRDGLRLNGYDADVIVKADVVLP